MPRQRPSDAAFTQEQQEFLLKAATDAANNLFGDEDGPNYSFIEKILITARALAELRELMNRAFPDPPSQEPGPTILKLRDGVHTFIAELAGQLLEEQMDEFLHGEEEGHADETLEGEQDTKGPRTWQEVLDSDPADGSDPDDAFMGGGFVSLEEAGIEREEEESDDN